MTQQYNQLKFLADTVRGSVQTLIAACPDLPDENQALGRLKQFSASFNGEPEAVRAALSLAEALALVQAATSTLTSMSALVGSEELGAESSTALTQALAEVEVLLGAAIRREKADKIRGLYVIIDPEVTGGREPIEIARAAVRGGARMLQLRDKLRDKGEILPLAQELQYLCEANDVLLIVNDHVDLAAAVGSGGVHVGQTDLPVAQARQVLAPGQVLGRSNREVDLLIESQEMGADHVAFGAIYQTTTKPGGRGPQGPERLKAAREVTKVPLVAIGGITAENVAPVIGYGADAVCVTAAIGLADDPEGASAQLVEAIARAGGKV